MAQVQNMWALNESENIQGSVTYSVDWENQVSEIFLVSLGSNTAGRYQFNKIFNLVSCAVKYDLHLEHLEDKQRELFFNPSYPLRVTVSDFSFLYHPWSKHYGQENKGTDHLLKFLLIVKQILLVSILGNV